MPWVPLDGHWGSICHLWGSIGAPLGRHWAPFVAFGVPFRAFGRHWGLIWGSILHFFVFFTIFVVSGDFLKEKWRLRWYGETFGENKTVTLEQKSRVGNVQFKKTESELKIHIFNNMNTNVFYKKVPNKIKNLFIINFNKYNRRYFANKDKSIRITIDKNVSYSNIFKEKNFKLNKIYQDRRMILEIKSIMNNEDLLQNICQNPSKLASTNLPRSELCPESYSERSWPWPSHLRKVLGKFGQ